MGRALILRNAFGTMLISVFLFMTCNTPDQDSSTSNSDTNASIGPDQINDSPENVVNTIFEIAKSGNLDNLDKCCDPMSEDVKVIRLCDIVEFESSVLKRYFGNARINGEIKILDETANVPIMAGPESNQKALVFSMVKREGKWYLSSF